jgi:hypothetical protein
MPGKAVRFCVAVWLVLQFIYTPIHTYLEPHSEVADFKSSGESAGVAVLLSDGDHDGEGDHERHSAAEHQLKALRTQRAPAAEMVTLIVVEPVAAEKDRPQNQVCDFSGLSPPELPRGWQFLFRAALPVRAPSLLS